MNLGESHRLVERRRRGLRGGAEVILGERKRGQDREDELEEMHGGGIRLRACVKSTYLGCWIAVWSGETDELRERAV